MTIPDTPSTPQFTPGQVAELAANINSLTSTLADVLTQLAQAFIPAAQRIGTQLNAMTSSTQNIDGFDLSKFYYWPGDAKGRWAIRCHECVWTEDGPTNHVTYIHNGLGSTNQPGNVMAGAYNAALKHWQDRHSTPGAPQ